MNLNILFTSFVLIISSLGAVENSIIPLMEQFEAVDALSPAKYSQNQFNEIEIALGQKASRLRVVTYNMLFNLYDQNLDEVNRWPMRYPRVVELIQEMQPDVLGVQELYENQLNDLLPLIEDQYAFYSRPCEDGELNGIFYRKDRFELVDNKVWYISENPEVKSSETLTMLKLKDLVSGQELAVFNAHLAFSKINKRDFQARFIAKQIEPFAAQMATVFMGDLNTFPNRLDLPKLPFFDGDYIHRILTQGSLKNARTESLLGHLGPLSTFTNSPEDVLPFQGTGTPGVFLDHIFVSPAVTVLIHAVQPGTIGGLFPSDHMPVLVDILL